MFDLSISEILLVAIIGIVFIKAEDLPVVMKSVVSAIRKLRSFADEIRRTFSEISREAGIEDMEKEINADIKMIKGDDGKYYESYSIDNIELKDESLNISQDNKNDDTNR
ncbi:MAG: hypothetical protein R3D71_04860 [Rickettsiales bacterium]